MNYDGAGSEAVRAFVTDNVRMWIQRLSCGRAQTATPSMQFMISEPSTSCRTSRRPPIRRPRGGDIPLHVIAESDLNDVRILLPKDHGGYGLDAQWSDDFHHIVHTLLTGERQGYYADYGDPEQLRKVLEETFALDGCYSDIATAPMAHLRRDCLAIDSSAAFKTTIRWGTEPSGNGWGRL